MCPKGDDPFTTFSDYHTVKITTYSSLDPLAGEFKFIFQGEYFYFPANATEFGDEECQAAVESLPNIESASCTRGAVDSVTYSTEYTIQVQEFPLFPYENNIYFHDGNPSADSYQCETTHLTGGTSATCEIEVSSTGDIPGKLISIHPLLSILSFRCTVTFSTSLCLCSSPSPPSLLLALLPPPPLPLPGLL
jgi:hypothetical protein